MVRNDPAKRAVYVKTAKTVLKWCFYVVVAVFFFFPFYYMLTRSVMSVRQSAARPIVLIPTDLTLDMWRAVFSGEDAYSDHAVPYVKFLFNTLKIVVFNIIAVPLSASFVAFGFAKCKFAGKNIIFAVMLSTILLPATIVQVPLYVLFGDLHILNTYWPLMIPNVFGGGAMRIFLIRQFMMGIPKELDEAAEIDGAGYFRRYLQITLPNCTAVLIFIIVEVFVANWGDYYGPMIYMSIAEENKFTLAYAVFLRFQKSVIPRPGDEGIRAAVGTLMALPPLILFFCFQRNMVEGVVMSGIKG
ncbi:MAG: carbohydrate ABC transporter permease [Clostridia bacterium]|nr:carbohydrate ABC transporter permease [Clostridia bacterium]